MSRLFIPRHHRTHEPGGSDQIRGINSFVGEFITLTRAVTALDTDGSSADGTISTGEVVFDSDAVQVTNIGGYAVNVPPLDLNGDALSFDEDEAGINPPCRFISIDAPGWFYIQRSWGVSEVGGISPCWFELSSEPDALGGGGGCSTWIRGTENRVAVERRHLLYLDATETFPYLVNTILAHDGTVHDGSHTISVAYLAAPST